MNKSIIWLLVLILTGIGASLKFSTSHESMPIGCDEFGYLNLAMELGNDKSLNEPYNDELITPLIDTLKQNGISDNEIIWMVTPHAYHMQIDNKTRINQYPPATSLLLKIFPLKYRKVLWPFLVITLLILPLLFSLNKSNWEFTLSDMALLLLTFLFTVTSPFMTEVTRVNSVAPTFGILMAAGAFLFKKPFLSIALIAFSVNFRVANIILLLPVFAFFVYNYSKVVDLKSSVKFVFVTIVSIFPLLFYQYKLFGNPFSSTYSVIDKSFASVSDWSKSFSFYFDLNQQWLLVHIVAISLLFLFTIIRKSSIQNTLKLMSIPLVNYMFFIVHEVRMDYYPYASAAILLGVLLSCCNEIPVKKVIACTFIVGLTFVILISGIKRYNKREHISDTEARSRYSDLCNYKVVWGDLYSGTTEYVCRNFGFRYGTTTPRARVLAIRFLKDRNVSQAILLTDNTVQRDVIIEELSKNLIAYRMKQDKYIGEILIIE